MKKYHLYLWIIALVGLITSCSQDETDALQTDATDANRVTLTASLPADFAQPQPKSRALPGAPADYQLRCILEIWDTEATPALKVRQEICPAADASQIDFSFELTTAGTYKALLWADYIYTNATSPSTTEIAGLSGVEHYSDSYYTTTNGLKAVEQNLSNPQNPEAWDAFCAGADFTKGGTALAIPKVTLTRPFMKLTIAEKNAERFASCKMVNAAFDRPSKFDVATGTVTETKSYNINASDGWLNNDSDITIGGQTCKTLICLYLFADATDGTMGDIVLKFTATDDTKTLPSVTIPAGIPVKRNHRVNAAGNLIGEPSSSAVTMTVDIDSKWTEPDEEHDIISVWDGKYPTSADEAKAWMGTETSGAGDATAINHVFTITAARQLAALHYLVSNTTTLGETSLEYRDATYNLATDIDLDEQPWTSIGTKSDGMSNEFQGVFDGQGHTVQGMNTTGDVSNSGFFARVDQSNAIIKHLNVKGKITPDATTDRASVSCGGIAGTIYNGASIAFCSFEGTISATHSNNNKIYAGGIVGQLGGSVSVGQIFSCYSVVTGMTTTTTGTVAKGGIAGYVASNGSTIKGCYWQELTGIGNDNPYGAVYNNGTVTVENNSHFTNAAEANSAVGTMNGYKADYDYEWKAGTNGGYPVLVPKK